MTGSIGVNDDLFNSETREVRNHCEMTSLSSVDQLWESQFLLLPTLELSMSSPSYVAYTPKRHSTQTSISSLSQLHSQHSSSSSSSSSSSTTTT